MFVPQPHPPMPVIPRLRIAVAGTGFIIEDCHLVAYKKAGLDVVGIMGRDQEKTERIARKFGIGVVARSVEELLDRSRPDVLDIAVPPLIQPGVIEIAAQSPTLKGILAQKPLAMSFDEGLKLVGMCRTTGKLLSVNQNMRFDPSVFALRQILDNGCLGDSVLATIDMRAVPHWMPWAQGLKSLSTWIMSIHHLDTFRYWLGTPDRVFASFRKDPRTKFQHTDGINLYILEYESGARASSWDDVWAGPVKEGGAPSMAIRWRFEGTRGVATGTIGWPDWPNRTPSTIDFSTLDLPGVWIQPRWDAAWFPDAFIWPMVDLMMAIENGNSLFSSGQDNLETLALLEAIHESGTNHQVSSPRKWLEKIG